MAPWAHLREELSLINAAITHLASIDQETIRKSTSNPFISGYASVEVENANTSDESEIDIVIVWGTGAFRLPLPVQSLELGYDKIHAICETVERAHLISHEIRKDPQSLGDEALRLLDHIASVRASRVIDHKNRTKKARDRCMFLVGTGIGATLIKQCLLQSRVSVDPLRALIWAAVRGIFLLEPMTRDDLTRWRTANTSKPKKSSSVEPNVGFSPVTWRDVRDVELEYDAITSRPSTFSVNLPKNDEWPSVLRSLKTAATPEDTESVQRLRDIKRVLSEWRTSEPRKAFVAAELKAFGKKLLSLDGGGLKGISSLMLLQELMDQVARRESGLERRPRRPVDYFDLAGGTSTGGLIAILLFRLRMDVPTALRMYEELGKDIFEPNPLATTFPRMKWLTKWAVKPYTGTIWLAGRASYSGKVLEDAVDRILAERGEIGVNGDKDVKLWDPRTRAPDPPAEASDPSAKKPDGRGAMFVCATLHDEQRGIRFRTYETKSDAEASKALETNSHYDGRPICSPEKTLRTTISIKDAVRATSAAPTYFPEKVMDDYRFWDGGLLNNNPIDQVWAARNDLDDRPVTCLLSVGASYADNLGQQTKHLLNIGRAVTEYATNTEGKHKDFEEKWKSMQSSGRRSFLYARLNVPTGHDEIAMDKVEHMELLKQKTREYLQTYSVKTTINELASILSKPPPPSRSLSPNSVGTEVFSGRLGPARKPRRAESQYFDVDIVPGGVDKISPGLAILGAKQGWWQLELPCESGQVKSDMREGGEGGGEEGEEEEEEAPQAAVQVECDFHLEIDGGIGLRSYASVTLTFQVTSIFPHFPRPRDQKPVEISLSESTLEKIKATCAETRIWEAGTSALRP